jgi:hypothetical protein
MSWMAGLWRDYGGINGKWRDLVEEPKAKKR